MTVSNPIVILAPVLDLTQADGLKAQLLAAFAQGDPVTVEAGAVQRVSSPCLQVLVAAARRGAVLVNPSVPLREVAAALDLSAELGIA
ncbi:MAG TPA: STAS domain-containing protein [Rhizomicrobium sp.]|nr:STAS domain-containing protein [Rhizomicrobium sp.]